MVRSRLIETDRVLAELAQGSDRAVALVGGSLVEHTLFSALCRKLGLAEGSDAAGKLEGDRGPLATFDFKIKMAEAIGVFGKHTTAQDVKLIKKIRNEFAHDMNLSGFDNQKVSDWVASMEHSSKVITGLSPRAQFISAVSVMSGLFITAAVTGQFE